LYGICAPHPPFAESGCGPCLQRSPTIGYILFANHSVTDSTYLCQDQGVAQDDQQALGPGDGHIEAAGVPPEPQLGFAALGTPRGRQGLRLAQNRGYEDDALLLALHLAEFSHFGCNIVLCRGRRESRLRLAQHCGKEVNTLLLTGSSASTIRQRDTSTRCPCDCQKVSVRMSSAFDHAFPQSTLLTCRPTKPHTPSEWKCII